MVMAANERPSVPATEVRPKARRRNFPAAYKRKVLEQVDACSKPGEISALLRREGLYSSHLVEWRAARERGTLDALTPKKRGPKAQAPDARDRKIAELEHQLAQLTARLQRAEGLVELQKKVAELLGTPLEAPHGRR
jgi:transposase-like protein